MKSYYLIIGLFMLTVETFAQETFNSTVTIDRQNEILFKVQDTNGNYSGYWTTNDGHGHMSIKLGNNGLGQYTHTGYGASELQWGGHNQDGYISLNAGLSGTAGSTVNYNIGLLVDASSGFVRVGNPNNTRGLQKGQGVKIADASGVLFTHLIQARDAGSGMDIDLGYQDGDLSIYDPKDVEYILGDNQSGDNEGIVLRVTENPSAGEALFKVESSGYSERLRVEHDGALSTTNHLHVINDEDRTNTIHGHTVFEDEISINTTEMASGYHLSVDGKAMFEEVTIDVSENWWPDYVFSEDYELRSLEQTEQFIEKHHHLPEVPSAAEVEEKGMDVGEMNRVLLQKIEELTLHQIEQQKQIEELLKLVKEK